MLDDKWSLTSPEISNIERIICNICTIVNYVVDVKKKLALLYAICRLKENPNVLFLETSPVYVMTNSDELHFLNSDWIGISVNGCKILGSNATEIISLWVASFLAFNIKHPKNLEATLELIEYGLLLRKKPTKKSVCNLLEMFPLSVN